MCHICMCVYVLADSRDLFILLMCFGIGCWHWREMLWIAPVSVYTPWMIWVKFWPVPNHNKAHPADGRTDWTSHIAAWSQLKISEFWIKVRFVQENAFQNFTYKMAVICSGPNVLTATQMSRGITSHKYTFRWDVYVYVRILTYGYMWNSYTVWFC